MDPRSLVTIAGTALVTAALVLIPFRASLVHAVAEAGDSKISQPKVLANGVELTLTCLDTQSCQQGSEPIFTLKAVNTTNRPTSVRFDARMTTERPNSSMSRVVGRPMPFWQTQQTLSLGPNETQELQLKGLAAPSTGVVRVLLGIQDPAARDSTMVQMFSFPSARPE